MYLVHMASKVGPVDDPQKKQKQKHLQTPEKYFSQQTENLTLDIPFLNPI